MEREKDGKKERSKTRQTSEMWPLRTVVRFNRLGFAHSQHYNLTTYATAVLKQKQLMVSQLNQILLCKQSMMGSKEKGKELHLR